MQSDCEDDADRRGSSLYRAHPTAVRTTLGERAHRSSPPRPSAARDRKMPAGEQLTEPRDSPGDRTTSVAQTSDENQF